MALPSSAVAFTARTRATRTRSKGSLATLTAVAAGLAVVLAAVSTLYDLAFAAAATTAMLRAEAPPKRPVSGYILWTTSRRPALAKEMPDQKITQLAKALGAEWNNMPEKEKATWNSRASELKEAYEQEVKDWTTLYGPIPQKEKRGKTPKKAATTRRSPEAAPPRAPSPYAMFVKANAKSVMAELHTTTLADAVTELARRWKRLTDEQKAMYAQGEAAQAKAADAASPPPPEPMAAQASPLEGKGKGKAASDGPEPARGKGGAPASKSTKRRAPKKE